MVFKSCLNSYKIEPEVVMQTSLQLSGPTITIKLQ